MMASLTLALAVLTLPLNLQLVSLELDAPVSRPQLERALALRGVSTTSDDKAATWQVRIARSSQPDDPVLAVEVRRDGALASSVRLVAGPRVDDEALTRNLALIVAQHTTRQPPDARRVADPAPSPGGVAPIPAPQPSPSEAVPSAAPTPAAQKNPAPEPSTAREAFDDEAGSLGPASATVTRRSVPAPASPGPWYLRLDAETSFLDYPAARLGPVLGLGYLWGRWSFELAAGYLAVIDSTGSSVPSEMGFVLIDGAMPGNGFVGRLGAAYALWRGRSMALRLGLAGEVDVNAPIVISSSISGEAYTTVTPNLLSWLELELMRARFRPALRVGWRQPLYSRTHHVTYPQPDVEVTLHGMVTASLGVLFDL